METFAGNNGGSMVSEKVTNFLEQGVRFNTNTPLGMVLSIGLLVGIPLIVRWSIKRNIGNSMVSELLFWLVVAGLVLNLAGVKLDQLLIEVVGGL
jgi:hypothetical protein